MDKGKVPRHVYIDLSEAFDTLDHSILLHKLNHYGVCGVENLLFRDYLSGYLSIVENLFFRDYLSGYLSICGFQWFQIKTKSISLGEPKGSILQPLLFLIYINDLPRVSMFSGW